MIENIKYLQEQKSKLETKSSEINKVVYTLECFYLNKKTPPCVNETIVLLKSKYSNITDQIKGFTKAIDDLQSVCNHKTDNEESAMVYYGHNSHKTYYECKNCGYKEDY